MCFPLFARSIAVQGSCPNGCNNVLYRNLCLIPLKNQCAVRFKHTHTLRKPSCNTCFHVSLLSFPYFFTIQALSPPWIRCGGSNTTWQNVLSSNGRHVKSAIISGWMLQYLVTFQSPLVHIASSSSSRLSTKTANSLFLLNQSFLNHM